MSQPRMPGLCVVITGAGSGIGLATTEAMLREGARVAALDLSPPATRAGLLPIVADVRNQEQIDAAVAQTAAVWHGRVAQSRRCPRAAR